MGMAAKIKGTNVRLLGLSSYDLGYIAYQTGRLLKENPFPSGNRSYENWIKGWKEAQKEESL